VYTIKRRRRRKIRHRVKVYGPSVGLRYKAGLRWMIPQLKSALLDYVLKETWVIDKCKRYDIPDELIEHYIAFAKRLQKEMLKYTEETRERVIARLIEEYVKRGLDRTVLEDIADEMGYYLRGSYYDWSLFDDAFFSYPDALKIVEPEIIERVYYDVIDEWLEKKVPKARIWAEDWNVLIRSINKLRGIFTAT